MQNTRGLHRKGLARREKKERTLLSERAHKQSVVFRTVAKNMHLILDIGTLLCVGQIARSYISSHSWTAALINTTYTIHDQMIISLLK